jgi:ABC-type multidrug transport system fused ATPase/permease subunit
MIINQLMKVGWGRRKRTVRLGRIAFEGVSFHYRAGQPLFERKNLVIEPGQKVGLVGSWGSGKTTFIHLLLRLSTLAEMDRILVFDAGRIVEDGSHEQLLLAHGQYRKLWQLQAGGFVPDSVELELAIGAGMA